MYKKKFCINLHAVGVKLMSTREPHDPANAVHIFLKTNHTFFLVTDISFPLGAERAWFLKYRMSRCLALVDWH